MGVGRIMLTSKSRSPLSLAKRSLTSLSLSPIGRLMEKWDEILMEVDGRNVLRIHIIIRSFEMQNEIHRGEVGVEYLLTHLTMTN